MEQLLTIDSIEAYNRLFGFETRHPLVSVIDMSSASDVNVALLAVKCDVTASSASSAT